MDQSVNFPVSIKLGDNLTITIDHMKEHHLGEIYQMFQTYGKTGEGICQYEYESPDDFKERFWQQSDEALVGITDSGSMVFAMTNTPSPLCRSSKPLFHAGYIVKHPDFEEKGIGTILDVFNLHALIAKKYGYIGSLGRTCTTTPAHHSSRHEIAPRQCFYPGRIPCSIYSGRRGWLDDIVVYREYGSYSIKVNIPSSNN